MCGCQMCDCRQRNVRNVTVVVTVVDSVTVANAYEFVAVAVHLVSVVDCVSDVSVSCVAFHHSDGRAHHGWCM